MSPRTEDFDEPERSRVLTAVGEALVGFVLAALVLWALVISVTNAEFVYQGF